MTGLDKGELDASKLNNNLYSIMTISDQFIPQANLNAARETLYK